MRKVRNINSKAMFVEDYATEVLREKGEAKL